MPAARRKDGGAVRLRNQYNEAYQGSKTNEGLCVSYHQLQQDLRARTFRRRQLVELLWHLLTVVFVCAFGQSTLHFDASADSQRAVEQLLLAKPFATDPAGRTERFATVRSKRDVALYLLNVVFPEVLDPEALGPNNYTTVQHNNVLFWGVRFRALLVDLNRDCAWRAAPGLAPLFKISCRPAFSSRTERTTGLCYGYQDEAQTGEMPFETNFGSYPPRGFVEDLLISEVDAADLKRSREQMLNRLAALVAVGGPAAEALGTSMLREDTAALIVSMTLYSPNTNQIAFARLLFEFLPSGLVVPTADVRTAPFFSSGSESHVSALVVALFTVVVAAVRLTFVARYVLTLRTFKPGLSKTQHAGAVAVELVIALLMALLIFDAFARVILKGNANDLLVRLAQPELFAGAGNLVAWEETARWILSVFTVMLALYTYKYMWLFYGLRFLWAVGFVAGSDVLTFVLIAVPILLAAALFAMLLFGPFSSTYVTFGEAFSAVLLHFVGYFSTENTGYASAPGALAINAVYLSIFVVVIQLVLINYYLAIFLKAFGIVYNESLRGSRNVRPELQDVVGGLRIGREVRAWCFRNRMLCARCGAAGSRSAVCLSVFCCVNHYRHGWLSTSSVATRLHEWKRKSANLNKNFLSFEELRKALAGDKKSQTRVDNYQVDFLFSICSHKVPAAEAASIQAVVDGLVADEVSSSSADYLRHVLDRSNVHTRSEAHDEDARASTALEDFHEAYSKFMELKNRQILSALRLEQEFQNVSDNQQAILALLRESRAVVDDLRAIPS